MIDGFRAMIAPNGRIYRGWWLVLTSANVQLLGSLLWMQSYGAYLVLLNDEFGWSPIVFSWAFALTRLESGILGPLQGWLVDRYGPRLILSIGMVLFGLGFMLFSQIETVLGFFTALALIAVGSSLGGFATLMVSLVNWFQRYRSTAVAVSQMGYSLGGIGLPVIVWLLEVWGWRTTAFVSGWVVLIVGIPLVQRIHHRPGDVGDVVDGALSSTTDSTAAAASDVSFTARQALATRAFWLISFGHAIALLAVAALLVHLITHLTITLKYSLTEASLVVSLVTGFQIVGQLSGGYLGDRFSKRWLCTACMLLHGAALLVLAQASTTPEVWLFAVLHGLAWGTRGPQMIALRADYFGASAFGTILGFSSLIVMFGTMSGPLIVAYLTEATGTTAAGLQVLAAICLVGAACFAAARKPTLPGEQALLKGSS
ncbi:MAG: MFS transporter [Pseudomonadota bacterium]